MNYVSEATSDVSDIFVERLASLMKIAGDRCLVVLSSTWGRPQHKTRLQRLEEALSRHLNREFTFDEKTTTPSDHGAEGRLRTIGDFLQTLSVRRAKCADSEYEVPSSLRVLILEDFYVTGFDGWTVDGSTISSTRCAEQYLGKRAQAKQPCDVSIQLIHTYTEWSTERGLSVQVGCGLTVPHFSLAKEFLVATAPSTVASKLAESSCSETETATTATSPSSPSLSPEQPMATPASALLLPSASTMDPNVDDKRRQQEDPAWNSFLSTSWPYLSASLHWGP